MDGAQIHLAINHSPLILTLCGLLIIIVALIRKHQFLFRIGAIFLLAGSLLGIPTYLSGGDAIGVIKGFPGVERPYIREHSAAAQWALYSLGAVGLVSLIALVATRRAVTFSRGYTIALLIVSLWAVSVVARTSHLGGQIRHQELRSGEAAPAVPETEEHD